MSHCCSTILYSIINNHIDCLKLFPTVDLNHRSTESETFLTGSSQHKFLEIIEYLLQNNCPYNEKFIRHIKLINLNEQEKLSYPILNTLIQSNN